MNENRIRLFISHSSKDKEFVQAVVELLRSALSLPSAQIRCTSIDGYRLPGGANTDQQLRKEVDEAESFIGIISPASIKSLYVIFELGARWGAGRSLIPLIAPGTNSNLLDGPLAGINALNFDNRSQIHQLIADLSSELGITPEPPSLYEHYIERIFNLKKKSHQESEATEEKMIEILKLLGKQGDYGIDADHVSVSISENIIKTKNLLEQLLKQKLIFASRALGVPTEYALTSNGRKFLLKNVM